MRWFEKEDLHIYFVSMHDGYQYHRKGTELFFRFL